jgi:hypothetical protein
MQCRSITFIPICGYVCLRCVLSLDYLCICPHQAHLQEMSFRDHILRRLIPIPTLPRPSIIQTLSKYEPQRRIPAIAICCGHPRTYPRLLLTLYVELSLQTTIKKGWEAALAGSEGAKSTGLEWVMVDLCSRYAADTKTVKVVSTHLQAYSITSERSPAPRGRTPGGWADRRLVHSRSSAFFFRYSVHPLFSYRLQQERPCSVMGLRVRATSTGSAGWPTIVMSETAYPSAS